MPSIIADTFASKRKEAYLQHSPNNIPMFTKAECVHALKGLALPREPLWRDRCRLYSALAAAPVLFGACCCNRATLKEKTL